MNSDEDSAMGMGHCKSLLEELSLAIDDALLGIVMCNEGLALLKDYRIILRSDHKSMTGKVKIIGGGGAGLEPADTGYVGFGMLTAAVVGDLFTSPSANTILVAIRELAFEHPDGILLIARNYTGNILNFELALENARSENICIKMIVVGDDGTDRKPSKPGRKGLAGCVFMYKLAGAMSEAGKSLDDIAVTCNNLCLSTVSVTLSQCCGVVKTPIRDDKMVFGMGAHGEIGVQEMKLGNVKEAVHAMIEFISHPMSLMHINEAPVALLINNLGSSTKLEESVVAVEAKRQLTEAGVKVVRQFSGSFMSSLDARGFSITILKLYSPEILKLLDAPTSAPAWPRRICAGTHLKMSSECVSPLILSPTCDHQNLDASKFENVPLGPVMSEKAVLSLAQITSFAAEALWSCEKQLNIIDSEVGDGDAGTMMSKGARAVITALKERRLNLSYPFVFLQNIGDLLERHIGGTTGALYSTFFASAAGVFQNAQEVNPALWSDAFKTGLKSIQHYGKAELGDRSLVDALSPSADAFEKALADNKHPSEALYVAVAVCEFNTGLTKNMVPRVGIINSKKTPTRYPDAGAHAAAIWLRAVGEGVKLHFLNLIERKFKSQNLLMDLLYETLKYCRENYGNDAAHTSALMGIMFYTHEYFTASRWRTVDETYQFFKQSILLHAVERPPFSIQIFEAVEVKNAVLFFIETYLRNLPLVRLMFLPNYKLILEVAEPLPPPPPPPPEPIKPVKEGKKK